MKIIELFNKIANGEVTGEKQIKIDNEIITINNLLGAYIFSKKRLNDTVEIIEKDKKIEHIIKKYDITDFKRKYSSAAQLLKDLSDKQYEIIDKLNEVLNDKD